MAYGGGMGYHLHMPSYFWRTFTEYPCLTQSLMTDLGLICVICVPIAYYDTPSCLYKISSLCPVKTNRPVHRAADVVSGAKSPLAWIRYVSTGGEWRQSLPY